MWQFSTGICTEGLQEKVHQKVIEKLLSLKGQPSPEEYQKLRGCEGYRIRVGNYRVLYTIDERERKVEVYSVAHGGDVYR